jgi:hypothetical protein
MCQAEISAVRAPGTESSLHMEDKLLWEVLLGSPDSPADTGIRRNVINHNSRERRVERLTLHKSYHTYKIGTPQHVLGGRLHETVLTCDPRR